MDRNLNNACSLRHTAGHRIPDNFFDDFKDFEEIFISDKDYFYRFFKNGSLVFVVYEKKWDFSVWISPETTEIELVELTLFLDRIAHHFTLHFFGANWTLFEETPLPDLVERVNGVMTPWIQSHAGLRVWRNYMEGKAHLRKRSDSIDRESGS